MLLLPLSANLNQIDKRIKKQPKETPCFSFLVAGPEVLTLITKKVL